MYKKINILVLLALALHASILKTTDRAPKIVCYDFDTLIMYGIVDLDFYAIFIKTPLSYPKDYPTNPYNACYKGENIIAKQREIYRWVKERHRKQELNDPQEISHPIIEAHLDELKTNYKKARPV